LASTGRTRRIGQSIAFYAVSIVVLFMLLFPFFVMLSTSAPAAINALIESPRILVTSVVSKRRHMLRKNYQTCLQLPVHIHLCVIIPRVDELAQVACGRGYVYSIQYHIVWCVKYRRKIITPVVERTLGDVIREIASQNGFSLEEFNCDLDHVHLLGFVHPSALYSKHAPAIEPVY
jgi:ABC-type glycerol-3-phosphate transport system permease component